MKRVGALGVVVATSCISPVMQFGAGKSARESQVQIATEFTPPTLAADGHWGGEVTTARIRVYADDEFRAQNMEWQETFKGQLAYANQVLASQFGVRLEPEFRHWDRHAPGTTLAEGLAELAQLDPGDDVLTVVGLTSSLSLVTATFDQLGYASIPGRHLVIRGYADVEERRSFERLFKDLSADERAALHSARRRHKTAALLLHELGHNFGANHRDEEDTLMSAQYSNKSSGFDTASRDIILATLDRRLNRRSTAPASKPGHAAPAPAPADEPAPGDHPTVVIEIDATGQRLVGGKPIDAIALFGLLRTSHDADRDTVIVIKANAAAPRNIVIDAAQRAKSAGLRRVSIVADGS